jgi:magnesium transporter
LHLSVRGLYKHVLSAITSPMSHPKAHVPENSKVSLDGVEEGKDVPTNDGDDKQVTFAAGPHPTMPTSTRESVQQVPEEVNTEREEEVTYRERLGGYLHPRDMRRLVTPFSASNEPELIVRRHAMLLNFDPLRAIILRDRLLVLVPEGADSLLMILEQRVRGGMDTDMAFFGTPTPSEIGSTEHDEPPVPKKKAFTSAAKTLIGKVIKKSSSGGTLDIDSSFQAVKDSLPTGSKKLEKSGNSTSQTKTESLTEDVPEPLLDDASDTNSKTEFFDYGAEWEEMKSRDWIDLPFELQCVDAVLHVVGGILSDDTYQLQQLALEYIQDILTGRRGGLSDDPLLIIRHIKDSIREMGSRLKGFVQSVERVLDEDEDMALMNLSRLLSHPDRFIKPVSTQILEEESNEPELILEASMQTGLTLTNALHLIQGQIDTASELVDQKLDSVRNKILFANMIISVFSLCVASASLVGSIFGMNLTNGLEFDNNAFKQVAAGTVCGAFFMCAFIMTALIYSGAIPQTRLYGSG